MNSILVQHKMCRYLVVWYSARTLFTNNIHDIMSAPSWQSKICPA